MKIIVGWWDPTTGQLVNIPDFDHVQNPNRWLPAVVDVQRPLSETNGTVPAADTPVPANLALVMKRRREELHLNKVQAARQAGISRTTWHQLETGERDNVQPRTWKAIAEVLGL